MAKIDNILEDLKLKHEAKVVYAKLEVPKNAKCVKVPRGALKNRKVDAEIKAVSSHKTTPRVIQGSPISVVYGLSKRGLMHFVNTHSNEVHMNPRDTKNVPPEVLRQKAFEVIGVKHY